ncbi:hypothetical protein THAOC_32479, partial [Thalassiosira oceanica]
MRTNEQGADARRHVAFRSGSPKNLWAPRAVDSSGAALDVNKLFLPPAHPWVVTDWKLVVELGASTPSMFMLDSFELEMDWFSTDVAAVLHPPHGWMEPLRGSGATLASMEARRDQHKGELFGPGPPSWGPLACAGGPSIRWAHLLHPLDSFHSSFG